MPIYNPSKGSDPQGDKLTKLIDLTQQSSQSNDGMLREISDSTAYIRENNPAKFKELTKDSIEKFTPLLKAYDDASVVLAKYKADLNTHVNESEKQD